MASWERIALRLEQERTDVKNKLIELEKEYGLDDGAYSMGMKYVIQEINKIYKT